MAQLGAEKAAGADDDRSQQRTRLVSPRSPDAPRVPADYLEGGHRLYQKKIKENIKMLERKLSYNGNGPAPRALEVALPAKKTIPITQAGGHEDTHDNTKFSTPVTAAKLSPALPAAKSQLHFGGTTTLQQTQEEFARRPQPNIVATGGGEGKDFDIQIKMI